ncbi:hypothetical protein CUC08_Gglean008705 [Alternaria sp. MG1]|nr:hypothetical protein CUC08_Gglean008705 [Alternaria sp. MG1]
MTEADAWSTATLRIISSLSIPPLTCSPLFLGPSIISSAPHLVLHVDSDPYSPLFASLKLLNQSSRSELTSVYSLVYLRASLARSSPMLLKSLSTDLPSSKASWTFYELSELSRS